MKTIRWTSVAVLFLALATMTACRSPLQGSNDGDTYYSPKAAYAVPLYLSPFRGQVEVNERCNASGGSTTFWDSQGRFFRIDYLKIDENPMALAPRFASDQTLLNSVMNNYLREVLPSGKSIEDVDTTVREFLKDRDPRALFVILNMNVNSARATDRNDPLIRGTYYYGFLLFKRGEFVYVVQHYQPAFMREKMLQVLTRLADNLETPGKVRSDTDMERARAKWNSTIAATRFGTRPAENEEGTTAINPIRPCD